MILIVVIDQCCHERVLDIMNADVLYNLVLGYVIRKGEIQPIEVCYRYFVQDKLRNDTRVLSLGHSISL